MNNEYENGMCDIELPFAEDEVSGCGMNCDDCGIVDCCLV